MEGDGRYDDKPQQGGSISIHSLRMEGDGFLWKYIAGERYFNPLPPYGGRPEGYFLSEDIEFISIHSLRMEGDFLLCNV